MRAFATVVLLSGLIFYSVHLGVFASSHLARLKGWVCLFVVNTSVSIATSPNCSLRLCLSSSKYFLLNARTVLSVNLGKLVLNSLTLLILTFPVSYFSMVYLSFSDHFWYCDCRFTDLGEATSSFNDLHVCCTNVRNCCCLWPLYDVAN